MIDYCEANTIMTANMGTDYDPKSRKKPSSPLINSFRCKDGEWVMVSTITAKGEITDISFTGSGRRIVTVTVTNQRGESVLEGVCKNMSLQKVAPGS